MNSTTAEPQVKLPQEKKSSSLSDRLTHLLNRLQPSLQSLILIGALLIGGGTGLLIILFRDLIGIVQSLAFENLMGVISVFGNWTLAIIPIIGGIFVGFIRWLFPNILDQGVATLIKNNTAPKITPLRPLVKMLAAAISLGTGASLGPEGPSVEIGSNIGVLIGQSFKVSKERYRLVMAAGAGAGLAAGFNAPIAGVFFALEVVLGTSFSNPVASLVLLSAVVSSLIGKIFLEGHPSFDLPPYQVLSHWEWIYYFGLGLLASLVSILYTKVIKLAQDCFQGKVTGFVWLSKIPSFMHPAIGGAFLGLVALQLPQILGMGYGTLEVILRGEKFPLTLLFILLVVKIIATAISLGSGLVGGVFAPAMFIGACLGEIYGNVLTVVLPSNLSNIAPPAAYAMVGMAAVLAGSVRAPLTAILLLFELTQNYLIILPLMAAVGVSVWLIEIIQAKTIFRKLEWTEIGINLPQKNECELLQHIPIAKVMQTSYLAFPDSMPILAAGKVMIEEKCHTAMVLDENKQLSGVISLNDIKERILQAEYQFIELDLLDQKLKDICTGEILTAYEDESLSEALKRMEPRGLYLLPIVTRDNPKQLIGLINRNQISLAADLIKTQTAIHPFLPSS